MNCPLCGNVIANPGRTCGGCGLDFGEELFDKLEFYFSLKDELRKLADLRNSLYSGIANVNAKIERYEAVLTRDLQKAALAAESSGLRGPARGKN